MKKLKIVIGVTGASGSLYAKVLFQKLVQMHQQIEAIGLVFSSTAKIVWKHELGDESYDQVPFTSYDKTDFTAPFASGSAGYNAMIVCPCSMGTMGRIASGISDDLVTRAADVMLKERGKLILVIRDTPYNLIHIQNMKTVTLAGAVVCPATPSFYSRPETVEELAATVVDRALLLAGLEVDTYQWGKSG